MGDVAPRSEQLKEAEELFLTGPERLGVAKGLFLGQFVDDWVMPFPAVDEGPEVEAALAEVRRFAAERLDAVGIDRRADIPPETIAELGRLGVLGMTAPREHGGRGFSQTAYCRVMEVIGGTCGSTSVFTNAHHSIGIRGLLLFGTEAQKQKWLRPLTSGAELAAFALTEPDAGSDAAGVRTTATPSADGSHYVLNGEKRYITNGAIAKVLTVIARTPAPEKAAGATSITAFLVTPDMPGFEVTEARMEKLGIRGTVTSRLAFHDMKVPRDNVLGPVGKGLRVALTVLDFGRTTFGATCTGAAKTCLRLTIGHAKTRKQFGLALEEFPLVREKIARMAAHVFAMEAMTRTTASLIDRGLEDYMLETAMLKVYASEVLWEIVNDALQIHGGAGYFTDLPLERMLRDARINQIGEGANDVLRTFIALVGMRGPGQELLELWQSLPRPWKAAREILRYGSRRAEARVSAPDVPVQSDELRPHARRLGGLIQRFDRSIRWELLRHGEGIVELQLVQKRVAEAAIALFASACVLSRLDRALSEPGRESLAAGQRASALYALDLFDRQVRDQLAALGENDDRVAIAAADATLGPAT
jgi:alkylation response protein AidB-like acyl-CoA dehydrogenase